MQIAYILLTREYIWFKCRCCNSWCHTWSGVRLWQSHRLMDASSYYIPPRRLATQVRNTIIPLDFSQDTSTVVQPSKNGTRNKCHIPSIPEESLQDYQGSFLYHSFCTFWIGSNHIMSFKFAGYRGATPKGTGKKAYTRGRKRSNAKETRGREQEVQCQRDLHKRQQEEQRQRSNARESMRSNTKGNWMILLLCRWRQHLICLRQPECPPMVCKYKKVAGRNVTWFACENHDQWYRIRCVNLMTKIVKSLGNWNNCFIVWFKLGRRPASWDCNIIRPQLLD